MICCNASLLCVWLSVALLASQPARVWADAPPMSSMLTPAEELVRLLPAPAEVTPWEYIADRTAVALQPEELAEVYGQRAGFYRDWKVLSAVSGHYRYSGVQAAMTIAILDSPRDAVLLYTHSRQAGESVSKVSALAVGQDAGWYAWDGKLYGFTVRDNLFSTAEFSAKSPLSQSFLPTLLTFSIARAPSQSRPFTLSINSQRVRIDAPLINNDEVFVPLKPVFGYLGYDVLWVAKTQEVVFFGLPTPGREEPSAPLPKLVRLRVNHNEGSSDGQAFSLDVAPFTYNGATYCAPQVFEKALGMKVVWDTATRRLEIYR